ncbi:MAG TPA: adenylate/guanylate cyclase domain-containing protein [Solirubrobacterales bacterium]
MTGSAALRQRQGTAMLIVAAIAAAIAIVAYAAPLLSALENQSVDARFSVRGTQELPDDIVVVQVDDRTFSELGVQWPFPRSMHARVIDRLRQAGAAVVAIDIQFTEPTKVREDNALIEAVGRMGGVVLSTTEVGKNGSTNVLGGDAVLREFGARAANTGVEPNSGGTYRTMEYEVEGLVTFPIAVAEAATGEAIEEDEMEAGGEAWIDFRGPPDTFRQISYSRVLRGKVPARVLRGKTVVIGASAPSLQDVHPTATSGTELMSGPELQANAIWTAENGFPLASSPLVVDLLLILLMAAAPAAMTLRLPTIPALVGALALAIAYVAASQLAFNAGTVTPIVYPLMALAISALGALAVNYVLTAFERQRVRDAFGRFVPEPVVEEVLARTDGDLRLGGVRREGTVIFTDLRGFTSFAEQLQPDLVITVLNHYLEEMSDAIMDHGGTLVAYMGDGIMAVFGAPLEQDDHADRALAAAREMIAVRLPSFNRWMQEQEMGRGFEMGIGVNSGSVMSGQVGSKRRIEYTAIGDTTNTAARLESMTKGSGHQVFLAESTRQALTHGGDDLELVGEREVRGRAQGITIWTLSPPAPEEVSGADDQGGDEEEDQMEGLVDGDPQSR